MKASLGLRWLALGLIWLGACDGGEADPACAEEEGCGLAAQLAANEESADDAPVRDPLAGGPWRVKALPLSAQTLVADPGRGRIYALVSGAPGPYANQIVTLDGVTGAVLATTHVGSNPSAAALADDGSMLWVGLAGAHAIRRVELTSATATPAEQYTLPRLPRGESAPPTAVIALPGQPRSVAVTLGQPRVSQRAAGLVILDDGVQRLLAGPERPDGSQFVAGPPGFLFGYDDESTGHAFEVVALTGSTRSHVTHRGLIDGFANGLVYAGQRVYARSGEVVDVSRPNAPVRAGEFAVQGAYVLPFDAAAPVMLEMDGWSGTPKLRVHVLNTATITVTRTEVLEVGSAVNRGTDPVRLAVQADPRTIFFLAARFDDSARVYALTRAEDAPRAIP